MRAAYPFAVVCWMDLGLFRSCTQAKTNQRKKALRADERHTYATNALAQYALTCTLGTRPYTGHRCCILDTSPIPFAKER